MDDFRASFIIYGNSSQHGRCVSQEGDDDNLSANNWSMDLLTNGSDADEDVSCTSGQSTDSDLIVVSGGNRATRPSCLVGIINQMQSFVWVIR